MKNIKVLPKDIYIDIDGVILTRGVTPSDHLDTFLEFILSKYSVSWLTSRCRGDTKVTLKYLSQFLSVESMSLVKKIRPTNFLLDKTEAIDFNRNFVWLNNELFVSEEKTLKEKGRFDSWIKVNLMENPNQLIQIINRLKFS